MAETLRVGFIGAGANTRLRHIPGFQAIEDVALAAVCNRTPESGHRVADEFGIDRVLTDPEEIFADPDIDAVCIGTWPYRHREFAVRALDAGKHVLTEARMAMDAAEAREMLEASRRRPDLVAQIVPAPYDLHSWPTIQRLLREGALGDIREVQVTIFSGNSLDPDAPLHWREQQTFSGVNVMTFGIYAEVVSRWLGPVRRVIADGATFVDSRVDAQTGERRPIDVPDSLGVLATLQSGARATFRASTLLHVPRPTRNGISVYGSAGTLHWEFGDTMEFAPLGEDPAPLQPDAGTGSDWRVEAEFVDSIRTGAPVRLTNFDDGLHYMRVTEAVARSIAEGRAIDLDEV
ncbi:MAG: Gfo/Idh/MocA family oxidoreductase [Dehalococcoidia bacterium]